MFETQQQFTACKLKVSEIPKVKGGVLRGQIANVQCCWLGGATLYLQHPLCIQVHLLDYLINELALIASTFLDTLTSSVNDLNKAFRSHDGSFEYLFLTASRLYLHAQRSLFAKLDEADMFIQLMRDSLA
jgi:hypothetical protein